MVRTVGRVALVGALLCGGALAGCSAPQPARTLGSASSSGTSALSSTNAPGAARAPSAGPEAGTRGTASGTPRTGTTTGRPLAAGPSTGSRPSTGARPSSSHPPFVPTDPRKSMPVLNPAPVAGIGYGPASSQGLSRLAPVHMASADLLVTYAVSGLRVGGRDVGVVGVYRTKPGMTASAMFQQQYVVQLINAVTGSRTSPRFVQVDGSVMALSTGAVAVAGWFRNGQVVLVYRNGTWPDLAALATGVQATPPQA